MMVADRFIYLQLHQTAGSLINDFLRRFVPDARLIGQHLPRRLAPPSHAELPALGFVRSPWSFYFAWYRFQQRRRQPNAIYRVLSENGRLDFEHTVANMLELGGGGARLDELLRALPQHYTNTGLNLPGPALEPIRGSGHGLYSYLYGYLYDAPGVMLIRRLERLRAEWPAMLSAVGQPVSNAMRAYLEEAGAAQPADAAGYAAAYGAALRALVAERDAAIITRHGYQFGE